jgi:flavin reductase (DIM6/NTAB) family NADH-FMN oxidoreductase RutF
MVAVRIDAAKDTLEHWRRSRERVINICSEGFIEAVSAGSVKASCKT